jgi:ABC-type molybdate transport system substrate-binding protein
VVAASAHPTEAAEFLTFCASPAALAIFGEAGFQPPPSR